MADPSSETFAALADPTRRAILARLTHGEATIGEEKLMVDQQPSAARELTIERTLQAPPALVFKAWTDPAHLVHWLGPKDFTAHDIALDLRPGGTWRACITSPDGDNNWMGGTYREVSPPDRLVFTFAWESTGFETLVTLGLAAEGERTLMTFHQAPFVSDESRSSHDEGWSESFDRLAAFVAAGPSTG